MKSKPTVSIVIPALNEEKNIKNIIFDCLAQKTNNDFVIDQITVISDGSDDSTCNIVRNIENQNIRLIEFPQREGKLYRLVEYFSNTHTDFIVQYDADVRLHDENTTWQIVNSFTKETADLVCGRHIPNHPKNIIQTLAYTGYEIWEQAKSYIPDGSYRHRCVGSIRGFSRKYYTIFNSKIIGTGAEDVYSYFFAKSRNLKVVFNKSAIVRYNLPSTFSDYRKQMSRFLSTDTRMEKLFGDIFRNEPRITNELRKKAIIDYTKVSNIHLVLGYFILQSIIKVFKLKNSDKDKYDQSVSTK